MEQQQELRRVRIFIGKDLDMTPYYFVWIWKKKNQVEHVRVADKCGILINYDRTYYLLMFEPCDLRRYIDYIDIDYAVLTLKTTFSYYFD